MPITHWPHASTPSDLEAIFAGLEAQARRGAGVRQGFATGYVTLERSLDVGYPG